MHLGIVPGFQSSSCLAERKAKFSEGAYSHRAVVSLDTLTSVCSLFSRPRFFFFSHHMARLGLAKVEATQTGCSQKGRPVVESKVMAKAKRAHWELPTYSVLIQNHYI